MAPAGERVVVVFGGTGFLGRRIVRHLRERGFFVRVASRHPQRTASEGREAEAVAVDIHDERSVSAALVGAYAAVNAVSLYVEHGAQTFHAVHVDAARRVAAVAQRVGVARLAHLSGIGSDATSSSLYIRKRGEGERVVRNAFDDALIVRPAVMFGPDDAFLTVILGLLRRLPLVPMFGRGLTRLQPAYVEDVAEAIATGLHRPERYPPTIECAGPRVYTYEELLKSIADHVGRRPVLIPVPFALWHTLAWGAELLPSPPVTRNQIELMQVDNVQSPQMPGLVELGVSPHSVEEILRGMLGATMAPSA
jgi:NADH dehydrogenase